MNCLSECVECGKSFSSRRKELGYRVCLDCGEINANKQTEHKKKCSAPLFNKGAYQYVSSKEAAKWIGR